MDAFLAGCAAKDGCNEVLGQFGLDFLNAGLNKRQVILVHNGQHRATWQGANETGHCAREQRLASQIPILFWDSFARAQTPPSRSNQNGQVIVHEELRLKPL